MESEYNKKIKRLRALREALYRKQQCGGCGNARSILRIKIASLEAELKSIEAAIGVHARPVGNYENNINPN